MKKSEKQQFFDKLAVKSNQHSSETAKKVYYGLISLIMDELRAKEEVELPDWGEYYLKTYPPRKIKDVNSGNMKQIGSKKSLKFTPDYKLKDYVKDMETRLSKIEED